MGHFASLFTQVSALINPCWQKNSPVYYIDLIIILHWYCCSDTHMVTHQYSKSRQGEACWYFERRAQGQGSPHFAVSMNWSVQNISKSLWRIVGLTFHFLAGGKWGFIWIYSKKLAGEKRKVPWLIYSNLNRSATDSIWGHQWKWDNHG